MPPEGWSPDHLLLAALVRCSIDSFAYHARRAGHEVTRHRVGARGRHEVAATTAGIASSRSTSASTLQLTPRTNEPDDLIAKAERDCFVGASLDLQPRYEWHRLVTDVVAHPRSSRSARASRRCSSRSRSSTGPGGTQVPDSVIDAIADYLRESNANLGGPFRHVPAHRRARSTDGHGRPRAIPQRRPPTRWRSART